MPKAKNAYVLLKPGNSLTVTGSAVVEIHSLDAKLEQTTLVSTTTVTSSQTFGPYSQTVQLEIRSKTAAEVTIVETEGLVLSTGLGTVQVGDSLNLLNYVSLLAGYRATQLSSPINYSESVISTTNGSKIVTQSGGTHFSAADVGSSIVILTPDTENSFQSTIEFFDSSTQVRVADNVTFTASNSFAYWGTDSTTQIDAALLAAKTQNRPLYVGPGYYFYNGAGLSGWSTPTIIGDNALTTIIFLGVGKRFVDANEYWYSCNFSRVGYFGGAGAIRNRYADVNVAPGPFELAGNYCRAYSQCAMSFNSVDFPYLDINGTLFDGINSSTTVGIAAAGLGPGSFTKNSFVRNRIHMKFGLGGNSQRVIGNDFIQFGGQTGGANSYTRASIWIVPSPTFVNSSNGCVVDQNKFGNENIDKSDVRLLFADSAANSGDNYFGETLPVTTLSTGYIAGMQMGAHNLVVGGDGAGAGSGVMPLVYSYTRNVIGNEFAANIQGSKPGYVLQFDSLATAANDYTNQTNVFGPFASNGFDGPTNILLASNVAGYGSIVDPTGDLAYSDPLVPSGPPTGSRYQVPALATLIADFTVDGGGAKAAIADRFGGNDAITFTAGATGANNILRAELPTYLVGVKGWIECWLKRGSSGTSVTYINPQITDAFGPPILAQRTIKLSSTWTQYFIPFVIRVAPTNVPPLIRFVTVTGTAVGETFDVGIVRVYHSPQPALFAGPLKIADTVYDNIRVVTASGAITATANDHHVCVNKSSGAASAVAIPAPVLGRELIVSDGKGDANSNNITITPASGTIDGGATYVINTAYGFVRLQGISSSVWKRIG